MAGLICKQCGYENPKGSTACEICAETLDYVSSVGFLAQRIEQEQSQMRVHKIEQQQEPNGQQIGLYESNEQQGHLEKQDGFEYYIMCPESHTKTVIPNEDNTKFFCEGCKREHVIDGFLWVIEKKESYPIGLKSLGNNSYEVASEQKRNHLWLEELNTQVRIEIDQAGGTLGRYGKYGAEFFQSRGLLTVSGEHCRITYELGNWVLRHISKTNETKYNQMVLGSNEPNLLEDGRLLTLANTVTFVVRIG